MTDNYSAPAYQHGDFFDGLSFDAFTHAAMSAVVGETDYQAVNENRNIINHNGSNDSYCAGCNGSFKLMFNTTSVGNVFWVVRSRVQLHEHRG